MAGKFETEAIEVVLMVIMVLVVSAMSVTIPPMITAAGFTGAAAVIVGLIPMMIPISVIVVLVMRLARSFKARRSY